MGYCVSCFDIRINPKAVQLESSYSRTYLKVGYSLSMERDAIVMSVAQNIEAAIKRRGTNPAEVARRAGINPTGVYDILSGKSRSPRLDTLYKIAVDGLQMPFSALFSEPAENEVDQRLIETLGMMPGADRRRFLAMAIAVLAQGSSV